jgi:Rieske Fe-S protein
MAKAKLFCRVSNPIATWEERRGVKRQIESCCILCFELCAFCSKRFAALNLWLVTGKMLRMSKNDETQTRTRRSFLLLLPVTLIAGVFSSIGFAAFRFLRPRMADSSSENWSDVASLSELKSDAPVGRKVMTDQVTGWGVTREQHQVYVLPGNRVLSAVCPHEGCDVAWDKSTNRFSCPCHESYFSADGARLSGPARRGLDTLPSRVQDGKLQVLYESYENNSAERIKRS